MINKKGQHKKSHTGDHGPGSGRDLSGGEFCTAPDFNVRISCRYQSVRGQNRTEDKDHANNIFPDVQHQDTISE